MELEEQLKEEEEVSLATPYDNETRTQRRNLIGFWLLGLTNNFAYVMMLTAAHDILDVESPRNATNGTVTPSENRSGKLVPECTPVGTGAILLADILPTLVISLAAPLYVQKIAYCVLVWIVVLLGGASFPTVAFAGSQLVWLSMIGIILASFGAGLGEITFLSLSSHFNKNCVSTWSSGTGAAGILGAFSYAGLRAVGISSKATLLLMLIVPVIMAVSYFILIVKPCSIRSQTTIHQNDERELLTPQQIPGSPQDVKKYNLKERIMLIKPLLKYMIPLGLVYFAEYFINQALYELVYFEHSWLPVMQQYRWYQVIYQVGVFISRSSVNIVQIKQTWIFPVLQVINVAFFLFQIFFKFIPSVWVVFVVILYEGLIGGAAYVNTFFRISSEIPSETREYSMGVASICNSIGIALAGAVAVPIRDLLCSL